MEAPIVPAVVVPPVVPPVVPAVVPPVIPSPILVPSGSISKTGMVVIAVCVLVVVGVMGYKYKTSQNNAPAT